MHWARWRWGLSVDPNAMQANMDGTEGAVLAERATFLLLAEKMGKTKIHSRHLSPRGGDLWCEDKGEKVVIAGETSLVIDGTIRLPDE